MSIFHKSLEEVRSREVTKEGIERILGDGGVVLPVETNLGPMKEAASELLQQKGSEKWFVQKIEAVKEVLGISPSKAKLEQIIDYTQKLIMNPGYAEILNREIQIAQERANIVRNVAKEIQKTRTGVDSGNISDPKDYETAQLFYDSQIYFATHPEGLGMGTDNNGREVPIGVMILDELRKNLK